MWDAPILHGFFSREMGVEMRECNMSDSYLGVSLKKKVARTLPTKNLQLVCNPLTQYKLCNHPIDAYLELRIDHGTRG